MWVNEGVKDGRHVIRLKIGDPFVFGRGGEEVLRFRSMCGIEPTVIPVSAAEHRVDFDDKVLDVYMYNAPALSLSLTRVCRLHSQRHC